MFLTDNLGFFVGLNDFKFALKSRLRIVLWLGTTVHFGSPAWMALDDFLGDSFAAKMMESYVRIVGDFWTTSGLLETIFTRHLKLKMDLETVLCATCNLLAI